MFVWVFDFLYKPMVTRDTILFTESLNDNRATRKARKISAQAVCTKIPGEGPRNKASPESPGGGSKKVQEPEQFEDRRVNLLVKPLLNKNGKNKF